MATCISCREKAGAFRSECKACEQRRLEANKRDQRNALKEDWVRRRDQYVDYAWHQMVTVLSKGRPAYLYRAAYVEIDSLFDGVPLGNTSFVGLKLIGVEGWEMVSTIPRTAGQSLVNTSGGSHKVYGGGTGGNVIGAYVLLRLLVTQQMIDQEPDVVRTALDEQFLEENPAPPD